MWQRRRPTFGLRVRATIAWALIALVLAAGVAVISYNVTRSELTEERRERAAAQAYLNARLVRSGLRASDPDLSAILSSLEGNVGSSSLTRLDGEWFASSVGVGPDLLPRQLVEVVEAGDSGRVVTSIGGVAHVVVGVPIAESAAAYYELLVLDDVDSTLASLARNLFLGAAAATVADALGSADGVLADPPPDAVIADVVDGDPVLTCRFWAGSTRAASTAARDAAITAVLARLVADDVPTPTPEQRVTITSEPDTHGLGHRQ